MTRQLITDAGPRSELRSPEAPLRDGAAIAQAAAALLAEMERSLEASQRALLSRDVAGMELATAEQIGLRQSLEILWSRVPGLPDGARGNDATQLDPALVAGLRAAEWRVLYLVRVQAALLTRAQRSLRMVSNLLAGPEASYAAPIPNRVSWAAASRANQGPGEVEKKASEERAEKENDEEAGPCRV